MSKESKKFPAVMTLVDLFGIAKGTVLRFDWASGKYVSIEENEDIAEDFYYSGYAISLDPYLVKDNIGTYFTFIEQEKVEEPEPEPVKVEEAKPEKVTKRKAAKEKAVEHKVTEADVELNPGEDLKAGETVELPRESLFPEYTKKHALVIDCACGHRHLIDVVQAAGVSTTIMAEDESTAITLSCDECGAKLKLWFATDEPTDEKSN